jgi:hypothetical protein
MTALRPSCLRQRSPEPAAPKKAGLRQCYENPKNLLKDIQANEAKRAVNQTENQSIRKKAHIGLLMLRKQTLMIFHYWVGTKLIYTKL